MRFIPFVLFLAACSTLDPLTENPFDTGEAANEEIDVCSNTGIGLPEESDFESTLEFPLTSAWLVVGEYYQVTAECLTIPPLQVNTEREGEWPISRLEFYVVGELHSDWIIDLAEEGLEFSVGNEEIGEYEPTEAFCDEEDCRGRWDVDLSEEDISVSLDEDLYLTLNLEGLDNAESIDALWDEEYDPLVLLTALWGEHVDETTGQVTLYTAISYTGMIIEPVDE